MQRTLTFVILIALLVLTPAMTASAQDDGNDGTIDVDILGQMTADEMMEFEEILKSMYYLIYEVQARELAQQDAVLDEEVFSVYPLVPVTEEEEDLALDPPPVFDEDSVRNIIF